MEIRNFISLWKRFQLLFVLSSLMSEKISLNAQPANPMFVRDCNDPLIQAHIDTGHSYCFHACGYFSNGISPDNDPSSCDTNGNCLCNYPCSNNETIVEPSIMFDTAPFGICPPDPSDVADTDQNALSNCMTTCATKCTRGQGMICGETSILGMNMNVYAKICTCYCPPQRCPSNSTQTSSSSQIYLLKNPLGFIVKKLAKKTFFKFFLLKSVKLCWLLFKVSSLYLFNSLLVGLYSYIFYHWISREYDLMFRPIFSRFNYITGQDISI